MTTRRFGRSAALVFGCSRLFALVFGLVTVGPGPVYAVEPLPTPGVYNTDQRFTVSAPDIDKLFFSINGGTALAYTDAVDLVAVSGEQRRYEVRLFDGHGEIGRFAYLIDKQPPPPPLILPADELTVTPPAVTFASSTDEVVRVFFSVDLPVTGRSSEWDGVPVQLSPVAHRTTFSVYAFAVDDAGNRSNTATRRITVDPSLRDERSLSLISPVAGRFANRQILYLADAGYTDVWYSTDGSDPWETGRPYTGPVVIDRYGDVRVRVAAKSLSGHRYRADVDYRVDVPPGSVGYDVTAGPVVGIDRVFFTNNVGISVPTRREFRYTTEDRSVTATDRLFDRLLQIRPQTGTLRYLVVRVLDVDERLEYRYVLLLDGRNALNPELMLSSSSLAAVVPDKPVADLSIAMNAQSDAVIRYAVAFDVPPAAEDVRTGTVFSAPTTISLPREHQGSLHVAAVAILPDNRTSEVVRATVLVDTRTPDRPVVESVAQPDGSVVVTASAAHGSLIRYSLTTDGTAPVPTAESPFISGPIRLTVPNGDQRRFRLRFVAESVSGRPSAATDEVVVTIDRMPPRSPSLRWDGEQVLATVPEGEDAEVQVAIASDLPGALTTGGKFFTYHAPIALPRVADANVVYTIRARARDAAGNVSLESRPLVVERYDRRPKAAIVSGIEHNARVNVDELVLDIESPEPGVAYHFVLSAIAEPDAGETSAQPVSANSATWVEPLRVTVPEGSEQVFVLRVLPVSEARSDLVGDVTTLVFAIDRAAPARPQVTGIQDQSLVNAPFTFAAVAEPHETLWYRLRPAVDWLQYRQPISIPVPADTEQSLVFDVKVVDGAGNQSVFANFLTVHVDTVAPPAPRVSIAVAGRLPVEVGDRAVRIVANSDVHIALTPATGERVGYWLSDSGTPDTTEPPQLPLLPRAADSVVSLRFPLDDAPSEIVHYRLRAASIDSAGNVGPATPSIEVVIDRVPPQDPPPPNLAFAGPAENPQHGSAEWPHQLLAGMPDDEWIAYRLVPLVADETSPAAATSPAETQLPTGSQPFQRVQGPIIWQLDRHNLALEYRAEDEAGNFGPVQTIVLRRTEKLPPPQFVGVVDGARYADGARLAFDCRSVRYAIGTAAEPPLPVDETAETRAGDLVFTASAGEVVEYVVAARCFPAASSLVDDTDPIVVASDETRIRFVVDNDPPDAPVLDSGRTPRYSALPVNLHFADADSRVLVAVRSTDLPDLATIANHQPSAVPTRGGFSDVDDIGELAGRQGRATAYDVFAIAVDEVGNQSAVVAVYTLIVDRKFCYVAHSATGEGDGSRDRPFRTIRPAVEALEMGHKTTIVFESGEHSLDERIELVGEVALLGGYSFPSWLPNLVSPTVIVPSVDYAGQLMLVLSNAEFTMQNVQFIDGSQPLAAVLVASDSSVHLRDVGIGSSHRTAAFLAAGSRIDIDGLSVFAYEPQHVVVSVDERSEIAAVGLSIVAVMDPPAFRAESAPRVGDLVMLRVADSVFSMDRLVIEPGAGRTTTALQLVDSSGTINAPAISGGDGEINATAVELIDSRVAISGGSIFSTAQSRNSSVVQATRSTVELARTSVTARASFGAIGLFARMSTVRLTDVTLVGEPTSDFSTLIAARQSEVTITDSRVTDGGSAESTIGDFRGGSVTWSNSAVTSLGSSSGRGLLLAEGATAVLEGNTIEGAGFGTAVFLSEDAGGLQMRNNVLRGWAVIIRESTFSIRRDGVPTVDTGRDLERFSRRNSVFEGNRVESGL